MKNTGNRSYFFLLLSFVVPAPLVGTPAHAQDKTSDIDKIFSWATPASPGCAVAASHHGKLVVNRAYGLADLERDVPISPATLFDAASIRKQFVAAAVFLLVEEGRLSLSDDVRKHVPELPDYGHKITLDHLLTHTSGLRDWVPLRNWANGSYDAMTMILRQRALNFAPGEEWSYSNSGYVLLTERPLVAVSKDRFRNPRASMTFRSQDEFELTFLSQDQFELKSMEGQTTRYRRAQPYTPTAADLEAFAGRYESDELRAVLQMAPGKAGLTARLNDAPGPGLELTPVDRDTFQRGMMTVRFLRDKAGKVVALDLNNPVLRNIRFTRQSGRTSRQ